MKAGAVLATSKSDLLTTSDVVRLAREGDDVVTPDTVRHWERTGKLPALRVGNGQRLFRRETVEGFLALRRASR